MEGQLGEKERKGRERPGREKVEKEEGEGEEREGRLRRRFTWGGGGRGRIYKKGIRRGRGSREEIEKRGEESR